MINSANLHDDLDVVTSVYLPEASYTIYQPSFDQNILNPNERILDISTNAPYVKKNIFIHLNFFYLVKNVVQNLVIFYIDFLIIEQDF